MARKTIRRALLFMPGDDRHKIEKAASFNVDAVIMDLEDGVAQNGKENARQITAQALREVDFGLAERFVRLNSFESGLVHDDFKAVIEGHPEGFLLPKIEYAGQIQDLASWCTRSETRHGWPDNSLRIIAIVETAMGIVNLRDIATASPRLIALAFGAEDLASSMGAVRTPDGWEVFYARSAVALYAKAFNLQAIDSPYIHLKVDDSLLKAETEKARYMGYTGKFAIHPKQVPVIQQVFTPTPHEVAEARALIDAHDAYQSAGSGVFAYEGRMVDMPMVRAAQQIIERARAAGMPLED